MNMKITEVRIYPTGIRISSIDSEIDLRVTAVRVRYGREAELAILRAHLLKLPRDDSELDSGPRPAFRRRYEIDTKQADEHQKERRPDP